MRLLHVFMLKLKLTKRFKDKSHQTEFARLPQFRTYLEHKSP